MASGITAWVVWTIGAIAGWSFDVGQITVVALVLPLAWVAGRRMPEAARRRRPQRVLIVGSGQVARHVADLALRHPERGLSVVGCVDDEAMSIDGIDPPLLGRMEDLSTVLQEQAIDRVIVSFSLNSDGADPAGPPRVRLPRRGRGRGAAAVRPAGPLARGRIRSAVWGC